jgi:mRNA-degrading endonuclease toxin of MazEF toxin-antitoxin module
VALEPLHQHEVAWCERRQERRQLGLRRTAQLLHQFEVEIPPGSKVRGAVLADHVKSLDWRARRAERIARLPEQQLSAVVRLIATLVAG